MNYRADTQINGPKDDSFTYLKLNDDTVARGRISISRSAPVGPDVASGD